MKTRFLFPHSWRIAGYCCLAAFIIFGITLKLLHPEGFTKHIDQDVPFGVTLHTDIKILLVVFGLLFIAFSKERIEDEQITQVRLDSLQWAVYINYAVFILCVILINGNDFITIVAYSVITPLIYFIIRFRWKIYRLNRLIKNN